MVVFKILNKVSGQQYIGACRGDIYERWELYVRAADAGLEFPLYQELRELGEAQFSIVELDYAESLAEIKEMELMYCVEFSARSLQGYKFGHKDSVIKRCRKTDLDSAWRQDLEDEPPGTRNASAAASALPAVETKRAIKPRVTLTSVDKSAAVARPLTSCSNEKMPPKRAEPFQAATSKSEAEPREEHALEKSILAEGMGLMVQALNSAEQLSTSQQQARQQTEALTDLLAQSERALDQLDAQQQLASEKARQALEAVVASQAANAALREAQAKVRHHLAAAMQPLSEGEASVAAVSQLQQGLKHLLGRLKHERAAPSQSEDAVARAVIAPAPGAAVDALESRIVKEQEAKMVNRLKQLDQLVIAPQPSQAPAIDNESSDDAEVEAMASADQAVSTPNLQARAWVAPADKHSGGAKLLDKASVSTTVVHRRAKTASVSQKSERRPAQIPPLSAGGQARPLLTRKRLGLK